MEDLKIFVPKNHVHLYLFWFLIDNEGTIIPYTYFREISPVFIERFRLQMAISRIRPLLESNGFIVEASQKYGYKCIQEA